MPDTKPDPTPWEQIKALGMVVIPVGGTLVGVITWLASQPRDKVFVVVSLSFIVGLVTIGAAVWLWRRTIRIAGVDPISRRRFPQWYAVVCWVGAGVMAASALGVWHGLKDRLRPVARVEFFNGFAAPVPDQVPERTMLLFTQITQKGGLPPLEDARIARAEGGVFTAYPAVVADLKKYGTGNVHIENVRFMVERPQFGDLSPLQAYTEVPPAVEPHQFVVRLTRDQLGAEADLYRNGKRSAALPVMDDASPLARLHVGFEGDAGLYLVRLVVTVRDDDGHSRAVESDGWALVNTHVKRAKAIRD